MTETLSRGTLAPVSGAGGLFLDEQILFLDSDSSVHMNTLKEVQVGKFPIVVNAAQVFSFDVNFSLATLSCFCSALKHIISAVRKVAEVTKHVRCFCKAVRLPAQSCMKVVNV